MDDPYKALGLTKSASEAEIKKAYRKIAKTDHPDLNPDPAAAERFKNAAAAYDLLRDADKRARFDRGEIDASGAERPQRQYYRDFQQQGDNPYAQYEGAGGAQFDDLSSVFEDLFGARAGGRTRASGQGFDIRGQDQRYELQLDFLTAARGGSTRITLPDGNALEVKIPAGAREGQTIRLRGKGGPGHGKGAPGDALLVLHVADHPTWRREGNDIHLTLPITLDEAVLGGKVQTPTLDGNVALTIPKGASSGQKLRLRGRGIAGGDQYVDLLIVTPSVIDDELAAFMETWRKAHPYDPRKGMNLS